MVIATALAQDEYGCPGWRGCLCFSCSPSMLSLPRSGGSLQGVELALQFGGISAPIGTPGALPSQSKYQLALRQPIGS